MDIIYDSLIILGPLWIWWLIKNYSKKHLTIFFIHVFFFFLSPVILLLSTFVCDVIFHYIVLIYVWLLISYFSVSLLLKKHIKITSVLLGVVLNSIIISSIPNKHGQFYHWSYWRETPYDLDINIFDQYKVHKSANVDEIYTLVACEIKNKNNIDKWRFKVHYLSDHDTIINFRQVASYGYRNYKLDFFSYNTYRVPSDSSEYKKLFDKEIKTCGIISVSGKAKRFIEDFGGVNEQLQQLMVDFDFYHDFLIFKWENSAFWKNMASSNSYNTKSIKLLKKCN